MRIAALIKQVPRFESFALLADGRLDRNGIELEMSAYCRRAVSQSVQLAGQLGGGVVVLTLGPPSAEDVLREALAWGFDHGVENDGLHLCDPQFAGSDTLATARALAACLGREGPFDLILAGRNSIDAETGQVGPQLAELLGLPFIAAIRELTSTEELLVARCERDDGWCEVSVELPAVASVVERVCEPAEVDPERRHRVEDERIRRVAAADLGDGPWGQEASPTLVRRVHSHPARRAGRRLTGSVPEVVAEAVALLAERGALDDVNGEPGAAQVPDPTGQSDRLVGVLVEPDRPSHARELLGAAASLLSATTGGGRVLAFVTQFDSALGSWGADEVIFVEGAAAPCDVAVEVASWLSRTRPLGLIAPGTFWGREVAARVAARCQAALTGDAIDIELGDSGLVAWKPAFGGQLVAEIGASSPTHLVTLRTGVMPLLRPRRDRPVHVRAVEVSPTTRVSELDQCRDDDVDILARATRVVGVGACVLPADYSQLDPLTSVLDAELAATRKVTDKGWRPHSRQVGITGRSIAPKLYVAVGLRGKLNHMVGVRYAETILALNHDGAAPVFEAADFGIIADWREVVPLLIQELMSQRKWRPTASHNS